MLAQRGEIRLSEPSLQPTEVEEEGEESQAAIPRVEEEEVSAAQLAPQQGDYQERRVQGSRERDLMEAHQEQQELTPNMEEVQEPEVVPQLRAGVRYSEAPAQVREVTLQAATH